MNILFVSAYAPSRIRVRSYNFILTLARRGHAITLVCGATPEDSVALQEMRSICRRVIPIGISRTQQFWNTVCSLPDDLPLQSSLGNDPQFIDAVQREVHIRQYDVVHIEHSRASSLSQAIQRIPVVLDAVHSSSLHLERLLRSNTDIRSRTTALLNLARTRRYEATLASRFDTLVSAPEDAWAIQTLMQMMYADDLTEEDVAPIHIIPNGVDLNYFAPQPMIRHPQTLIFSGKMSCHANEAAALFLVEQIMPLVWARRPNACLVIAGSSPSRKLQELAEDPRILVTGFVEDLRTYLASATLAVAPLRYGDGLQNKVLEAMAMGTPVVATLQVARALQARQGREIILAEPPLEFAHAILNLLDEAGQRKRLGMAGRSYVERYHNWEHAADQLEEAYISAGAPAPLKMARAVGMREPMPVY